MIQIYLNYSISGDFNHLQLDCLMLLVDKLHVSGLWCNTVLPTMITTMQSLLGAATDVLHSKNSAHFTNVVDGCKKVNYSLSSGFSDGPAPPKVINSPSFRPSTGTAASMDLRGEDKRCEEKTREKTSDPAFKSNVDSREVL
jgi:hypothetical protein